jgi:type II secretory pathway component GspD/PulD (secretin)
VQDLIAEMDVSPEQIQITAVFGRYNLGDSVDFGVDFAKTYPPGSDQGYAAQNRTGVADLLDPTSLTDIDSFPDVAGFSLYGQLGKEVAATLNALESSGKFHLMARPTVFTTNNRRAILSSGQQVAVPTDTFTQGGSGNNSSQSTNIAYRDVLLELEVIPLVNSADEVTLQISFVNNNIIGETIIDGNSIPTIGQESIVTTVTVPNGETIVLGGLITERDETSESGIPVLMHIPGLKRLFSSIEKDVVREELVIFIQPQIVNGKVQLRDLQKRNADKSQLVRDIQEQATILPPKYGSPEQQEGLTERQLELPWYFQQKAGSGNQTFQQTAPTENKNRFRGVRR